MAKMLPGFGFTGTPANILAYTMRGSDKIILRFNGGASWQQMKSSTSFSNVQKNNTTFGRRVSASRQIMQMLYSQKVLADHTIAPVLNKLLVTVQKWDTNE